LPSLPPLSFTHFPPYIWNVTRGLTILVAEDDPNDVLLLKRAFLKNGLNNPVHTSPDGDDAINYLQGEGPYRDRQKYPFPSLLITDLKMPRSSGFDILKWLHSHPDCQIIPVIVFSASRQEQDILMAYRSGANAFIHKPATFEKLTEIIRITAEFWNLCEKPSLPSGRCPG
jgi:CheY-like chemotaxis protein